MSDADNSSGSPLAAFGKFVPGFDFLQNLATQAAGSAADKIPQLPNLGNWVAPTLNVEELDKRIQELKAVQFWLDQNASALKATIQALEVQKMTLATLKGMNFNMGDVANAFKLKVADSVASGVQRVVDKAASFQANTNEVPSDESAEADAPASKKTSKSAKSSSTGMVDPMQWWGALTQQFQTIAADAMKDAAKKTAIESTKHLATGLAKDAMKSATGMAKNVAKNMAKGMAGSASKTVTGGARAAMDTALRSSKAWPSPSTSVSSTSSTLSPPKPSTKTAAKRTAAGKTASRATPARKSSR